jgi:membrane protease YdiL (CAAX protease family)
MVASFVGATLLAAVITPWIHYWVRQMARPGSGKMLVYLSGKNPAMYFDRIRYVLILTTLPWILLCSKIHSARAGGLGMTRDFWRRAVGGFLYGFGTLLFLAGLHCSKIHFIWKSLPIGEIARHVGHAGISGAAIATLEEFLFRGLLFRNLRRHCSLNTSVLTGGIIFAAMHFAKPMSFRSVSQMEWHEGWKLAVDLIHSLLHPTFPYFLTLVALGILLSFAAWRHRHLGMSIGIHGGLVFGLIILKKTFDQYIPIQSVVWGTGVLTDSWMSCGVLWAICIVIVRRWCAAASPAELVKYH